MHFKLLARRLVKQLCCALFVFFVESPRGVLTCLSLSVMACHIFLPYWFCFVTLPWPPVITQCSAEYIPISRNSLNRLKESTSLRRQLLSQSRSLQLSHSSAPCLASDSSFRQQWAHFLWSFCVLFLFNHLQSHLMQTRDTDPTQ